MPDHDVVFSQLATELKDQVTPFVAVLSSKDCAGSNLSSFVLHFLLKEKDPPKEEVLKSC